jgi:hypothetical protein
MCPVLNERLGRRRNKRVQFNLTSSPRPGRAFLLSADVIFHPPHLILALHSFKLSHDTSIARSRSLSRSIQPECFTVTKVHCHMPTPIAPASLTNTRSSIDLAQVRRRDRLVCLATTPNSRHVLTAPPRLVATLGNKSTLKKVSRKAILEVDVTKTCDTIITPEAPMALRLQSNLM